MIIQPKRQFRLRNNFFFLLFSLLLMVACFRPLFYLFFLVLGLIINILACLIKGLDLIVSGSYKSQHLRYSRV